MTEQVRYAVRRYLPQVDTILHSRSLEILGITTPEQNPTPRAASLFGLFSGWEVANEDRATKEARPSFDTKLLGGMGGAGLEFLVFCRAMKPAVLFLLAVLGWGCGRGCSGSCQVPRPY